MKTYQDVKDLQDKAISQMEEILAKPENEITKTDFASLMRTGMVISNTNEILLKAYLKEVK